MKTILLEAPRPNSSFAKYKSLFTLPNILLDIAGALNDDLILLNALKVRDELILPDADRYIVNISECVETTEKDQIYIERLLTQLKELQFSKQKQIFLSGWYPWLRKAKLENEGFKVLDPMFYEKCLNNSLISQAEIKPRWDLLNWNEIPNSEKQGKKATLRISRGCPSFCLTKNTKILMNDFSVKKISKIKPGDKVIGLKCKKNQGCLVESLVLATKKRKTLASRVFLNDGSKIICSRDHRWLTNRGWKYTTGSMGGFNQRPYLTPNNHLINVGKIYSNSETKKYKRGYISGIMFGDGCFRTYGKNKYMSFRLVMRDKEAIDRTKRYLLELGLMNIRERVIKKPKIYHNLMFELRSRRRENNIKIRSIAKLKRSMEFQRGFVAGFFDAEGSLVQQGQLRIFNTDKKLMNFLSACLDAFNFKYTLKTKRFKNPKWKDLITLRIKNGIDEQIRFFNVFRPAIHRKTSKIFGKFLSNMPKKKLRMVSIKKKRRTVMYDIETTTGNFIANGLISHNCEICPVSLVHKSKMYQFPIDWCKEQISTLYKDYRVRELDFLDDNLLVGKNRAIELLNFLTNEKNKAFKNMSYTFREGLEVDQGVDEEIVSLLKKAGFHHLKLGVETFNAKGLKFINKHYQDPELAIKAIEMLKKYRLTPICFMLVGIPGEIEEDIKNTIDMFVKLKVKIRAQLLIDYEGDKFKSSIPYEKLQELKNEALERTKSITWRKR